MTGSDTDLRMKARAAFLAFVMVTSVVGATVAFSGSAAAITSNSASVSPAGEAAQDVTATVSVTANTGDSTVDAGDGNDELKEIIVNYGTDTNFDGSIADVDASDVSITLSTGSFSGGTGYSISKSGDELTITFNSAQDISAGSNVDVDIDDFQNPTDAGNSPYSVDVTLEDADGNQDGPVTPTYTVNAVGVTEEAGPTTAGDTVLVDVPASEYSSADNITAIHRYNGNQKQLSIDAETSIDSDGDFEATFQAAQGTHDVDIFVNGNEVGTVSYTASNYLVEVSPDSVTHGESREITGEIYEYPGVLETDKQVNYAVWFSDDSRPPGDNLLTDSNTNTGQFTTLVDFSEVDNNAEDDYPDDVAGNNPDPQYLVTVGTNDITGSPGDANVEGSDNILTRVNFDANPQSATYDNSPTFRGTVANATGALNNYGVEFRDPGGSVVRQTTTNPSGEFAFTKTVDDAGDWTLGTATGGFIGYQTVTVAPEQATVTLSADNGNRPTFPQTYTLNVSDADGNGLDTTTGDAEGYVNITGSFESGSISGQIGGSATDTDGDASIEFFHVETDGDGEVTFDATPAAGASSVTATLEHADAAADSDSAPEGGLEDINDAADTPESPDYVGSTSLPTTGADPVNILDQDVEDSQTGNPLDSSGNFDVTDPGAGEDAQFQSIFADNGPEVIEVLPQTDATGNRITNGIRLGYDENFDLDGMTVYRVSFELADVSNTPITPGPNSGDFSQMRVTGAGINATITRNGAGDIVATSDSVGVLDAEYVDLADGDRNTEYTFLIRPSEVTTENPSVDTEIDVNGESNVTYSVAADGLDIAQFEVNGQTRQEIEPNQNNVDVNAIVEDATKGGAPINNGRVRLSQNGTALDNFDARTKNINNGRYQFTVDVGPRGFDSVSDDDGVGETTSSLDFTAYQYADANDDQVIVQREVDKGAVESLPIALDKSLQVEYQPGATSKYSGFQNGNFTLTRGVEYDQIVFKLTDANGNPVNLTKGLDGNEVSDLNEIAFEAAPGGAHADNPELVQLSTTGGPLSVRFDNAASDPANGTYVISDIEEGANVDTSDAAVENDDTFVINAPSTNAAPQSFTLSVQTPDRSEATASDTGTFVAASANVNATLAGAAGDAVPNSVSDTDNDGDIIDNLNNDQSGFNQLNTSVSDIETPTAGVDRVYRLNATVTDALGTPLNSSDFNDIDVDFDGSVDPTPASGNIQDNAKFEMVSGPGVSLNPDDGDDVADSTATTTNDEAVVTNEAGEFQFDIEVESAGNDGSYTPVFEVEAQADTTAAPAGKSDASQAPTLSSPVVNVLDRSGAALPTNNATGNEILAQGVTNQLRVEAFPADTDGFTLADGQAFGFTDPKAENTAGGTTTLSQEVVTGEFEEGQKVEIDVTPTGTGNGVIELKNSISAGLGSTVVRDADGDPIRFDVLSSNLQVDILLSSTSVEAGNNVTVTLEQQSTGQPLAENTRVSLVNPDGNEVASALTDANGVAELTVPANASVGGTFTVQTRPAGFAPNSVDLTVTTPQAPASVTFNDKPVQNGTTTVTVDSVTLDNGGFVVIHDSNLSSVGAVPSVIGSSAYLAPGTTENVQVQLNRPVTSNETLVAMAHRDTNGNQTFEFVSSNGSTDGAYTFQGQPVTDSATLTTQQQSPLSGTAARFDDDADGDITAAELGDAVNQFAANQLTAAELGDVVNAFASS